MGSMIGFAGLSHLGIVSGMATAAKGFRVLGYDGRPDLVSDLTAGRLPVHEPDLPELYETSKSRLAFTSQPEALGQCALTVLSLDTPTNQNNESDLTALDKLADTVLPHLARGTTLVILSQVRPGYTRSFADRNEALLAGRGIQLFYQVETLIFGRAVERATRPERFIVGAAEPVKPLPDDYKKMLQAFACPIFPMRYESAELTKIAINIYLTASVSVINTLAELCEKLGADWLEIEPTLRLDKRIGQHAYLSPGLGIAGGNLERDLCAIKSLASEHGTEAGIIDAFLNNSRHYRDWVLRKLYSRLPGQGGKPVIGMWGLAYKPNTKSIKNSPALSLLEALPAGTVRAYDPEAELIGIPHRPLTLCPSALEASRGADALVLATAWPEFAQVDLGQVRQRMRGRLVIDPFGCLDLVQCQKLGFDYCKLGYSHSN